MMWLRTATGTVNTMFIRFTNVNYDEEARIFRITAVDYDGDDWEIMVPDSVAHAKNKADAIMIFNNFLNQ